MTPAQKAGLKVGDKIRYISERQEGENVQFEVGDVLVFIEDDMTVSPYFRSESTGKTGYFFLGRVWEKVEMQQPKFKRMKFWCENKETLERVCHILDMLGYEPDINIKSALINNGPFGISTSSGGKYVWETSSKNEYWEDLSAYYEEINIDWLTTEENKSETQLQIEAVQKEMGKLQSKLDNLKGKV